MSKQFTINEPFSLSGKGLHTGLNINAKFIPAKENTGIIFRRIDLEEPVDIPALASYVSATERGTVLKKGDASVSTIEHIMSAFMAHGIDNCIIEVNAPEVPILDGSAKLVVEAINKVGIKELDAEKKYYEVKEEMTFTNGNSTIKLLPADEFCAEVTIDFNSPILKRQTASICGFTNYDKEISSARTFVFVREIALLLQHNLIKGGDLDNAIVIYDQPLNKEAITDICNKLGVPVIEVEDLGYLNHRPLEWDNEPARHKLLDLIGDLSLIGCTIKGKILAEKPGHGYNTFVAQEILKLIK
ncbi:MAG: UDP-3-O-[Paludibacteraceae bacterium]|nr:UDP-3-O-[3-hydroxymyristoyl] N-acetylglucosamine deacetylase [Paludibacteraceae bacterium]MBR3872256.1 UDP-3-O-[3-hydroxymyristoyl] N-acetylglucosamine deacetylase [Paludibacteraceae bacterium]